VTKYIKKISYDAIFVTSSPLRQPNDVTKITSHNFSILPPPPTNQNFWLRQCKPRTAFLVVAKMKVDFEMRE